MVKIRVLDEQTINKIAAGEVIENPASVVKELVENSIDAGSTDICVEIRGGGRQLIRITDDGCGMTADDAVLALERHATSKIRLVEDLATVGTMGFRGEAIPSIASISKFMLITSTGEKDEGTMVMVDGGNLTQTGPAARSRGTTIEVKSLFFNVPVRKKFQRSPTYDSNEILKVATLQALAHPGIKFQLVSDQKTMLTTSKDQTLDQRVKDVLGKDFYRGTTPIEMEAGPYTIKGVIGLPTFTRQNRTGQYLFVNKRAIQSPIVSYAIRDGYGHALATNRHPVWVVHISMPGDLVDVNVHPQKREVRMRQQQTLREALIAAVRKSLEGGGIEERLDASEEYVIVKPAFSLEPEETVSLPMPEPKPRPVFKEAEPLFETKKTEMPRVLTTIQRYLVVDAQKEQGLSLIDQRAAHSRIVFEKLLKGKGSIAMQMLLVPYTMQLPPPDAEVLQEHMAILNEMGISIHESGPNAFMVDAIPQVFGNSDLEQLIQDIVHRIREFHDASHFQKEVEKQMAQAASRAAVSNNKKLSLGEAQILLDQLMRCDTPLQCPFGRPTLVNITSEELAERFEL